MTMLIGPYYSYDKNKKYKFTLRADYHIYLDIQKSKNFIFKVDDKPWGSLYGGYLTIKKGFAWDGASPSKLFGFSWFSIPSPAETAAATLCHDFFYQYLNVPNAIWDRKWADLKFKRIMEWSGFKYSQIYYAAVCAFGGWFANKKQDELHGPEIIEVFNLGRVP